MSFTRRIARCPQHTECLAAAATGAERAGPDALRIKPTLDASPPGISGTPASDTPAYRPTLGPGIRVRVGPGVLTPAGPHATPGPGVVNTGPQPIPDRGNPPPKYKP
jgi:hypothetical protein